MELAADGPSGHDGAEMRRLVGGLVLAATVTAWPATALAQALTIDGSVTGTLARGRKATFRMTATHPDGWRALKEIAVNLSLRGAPLEELTYEVDTTAISAGAGSALAGTGDDVTGRFFRIQALDVRATTGGDRLELSFRAHLLEDVPPGARFEFAVEDDLGNDASIGKIAAVRQEVNQGFPWATVAAAAAVALLAGGFLGSRLAPHRRSTGRSIYHDVARRILEERERGSTGARGGRH